MYEKQESATASRLGMLLAERALENDTEMPCTQAAMDVFSRSIGCDIDYLDIMNLDNVSFYQAVYILCFNVSPSEGFIKQWETSAAELEREEFQKKFINSFVQRRDFGTFHVRLHNCFILRENSFQMAVRPVVPAKIKTSFKAKIYNKLWPLYMRLPAGFRRVLKKMLRGWFFTEERR